MISQADRDVFENLFILEVANNHWGSVERGLKIIRDHATVVRYNNVRAAIKLQFRDVDGFIHPDFKGSQDLRYIKKTEATKLSREDFARLVQEIRSSAASRWPRRSTRRRSTCASSSTCPSSRWRART